MRGGAALHGRKGGGAMPRGKRAYRVLLWAVLAALLVLALFAGWRLWRIYGDAARAAQLTQEMQQTARHRAFIQQVEQFIDQRYAG